MKTGIVIIGAGIAGVTCAITLRELGYDGTIMLISDEEGFPYKRTHLSKQLHRRILPGEFVTYSKQELERFQISYLVNSKVNLVDTINKLLLIEGQETPIPFETLILASGSTPKKLSAIKGSHAIYREADVHRLQEVLDDVPGESIHVVGGGILGVEVAEQLTRSGRKVNLYCQHPYPMVREMPRDLGIVLKDLLSSQGINLLSSRVFNKTNPPSLTVSALGVEPNISFLIKSGLGCDKGVLVNEFLETDHPNIFAIGDCAQLPDGSISHLWHQAEHQGKYCAMRMLGKKEPYTALPFRTKAEVFGKLIFSCGSVAGRTPEDQVFFRNGLHLWVRLMNNQTIGLACIGIRDKAFAKLAQEAVRHEWSLEKVQAVLLA